LESSKAGASDARGVRVARFESWKSPLWPQREKSIATRTLFRTEDELARRSFYFLRLKERHVSNAEAALLATRQQPWGITPGVAAAPVAFAGDIIAGLAISIETLSLHAAEFGVGMTVITGSIPVLPRSATGD
jgi:hypothetical protein